MTAPANGFAELAATTNFSFLRGASHAAEFVAMARALGLSALGVADRNTLAGVVRAHIAAKEMKLSLLVGARLVLTDGLEMICYPQTRAAYGELSTLLSEGKLKAEKGECHLTLDDVLARSEDQIFIAFPPAEGTFTAFEETLTRLGGLWPGRVFLAARFTFGGRNREQIARLAELGARCGAPIVATNDPLYHEPERRPLQDLLTCIREHCTIDEAGFRLEANAERYLKGPEEMARLFRGFEGALRRTEEIAARCQFSLDELAYEYPDEPVPPDKTPQQHLEDITWQGADWRYPGGVPKKVHDQLKKELRLIEELNYPQYFLTVHDIVAWARGQGILCQGRGSAANSAVCYCLGVTSVDPDTTSLLFERFISKERKEPPDIDVDFEHERREEVIQYVYRRYGRHKAALTATVISYRPRSAVREVCKALGLSDDVATALAGTVWGSWGKEIHADQIARAGLDPSAPLIRRAVTLTKQLLGFPRHLSQHVGGFVLTRGPLIETVPIGNAAMDERTFIEWDKDDIEALGIMKVDVLALGMLTCIRKAFDMISAHKGKDYTLATLPVEDPKTYDMLCEADSLGVFQVESRAQMNMLPRLRPRCFYDLVIEVAIVRPGPIQGDMVHPYLRRRKGLETISYPSPAPEYGEPDELERILKRTLGVPLFQEQAMQISIDAAKFTPEEANGLRRAMATFRKMGTIQNYEEKMVGRMAARGYDPEFAKRCFDQVKGFGEYGFPESHAASFALLVYVSSWLKCHHPEVFCAALLNSQPMGFYAPAQIVRDAREHGVEVRPVDVNYSEWDSIVEVCSPADPRQGLGQVAPSPCSWGASHDQRDGSIEQEAKVEPARSLVAPPSPPTGRRGAGGEVGPVEADGHESAKRSPLIPNPSPHEGAKGLPPQKVDRSVRGQVAAAALSATNRESGNSLEPVLCGQNVRENNSNSREAGGQTKVKLEQTLPIRLGFRQVNGLREDEIAALIAARGDGYESVEDIRRRSGISRRAVELLAAADAFGSIAKDRREALWDVRGEAADKTLPLFAAADAREQGGEAKVTLPDMPASEHVVQDYQTTRLSLKAHPMHFLRERYAKERILSTEQAVNAGDGRRVNLAGVVLVRQRPGSASGVVFMTLEDETGTANVVVWPKIVKRDRAIVMGARIVQVKGYIQTADNVTHVVARQLIDRTNDLGFLSEDFQNDPLKGAIANADEVMRPIPENRQSAHPRNVQIMPRSRDFH
tara:strand:- start:5648 stop:9328 length:3681 start_codon:yes stop_codon:yes gene_type:complete